MRGISKYILPNLLTIPMALHWILPSGMEMRLYLGPFFVPDILLLLYILFRSISPKKTPSLSSKRKALLVIICLAIIFYAAVLTVLRGVPYVFDAVLTNLSFVWYSLLFMFLPLNADQIKYTKPVLLGSLLILIGEVILYGSGLLVYKTASGNALEGQDYNGFMRISTTVGAATGTAVCIALLGAINVTIYKWKQWIRWTLIAITSIGVFFTMSRGSSLTWLLFVVLLFYRDYFKKAKLSLKIKSLIAFGIFAFAFYHFGGMDPLIERNEQMSGSTNYTAGRADKAEISQRMIREKAPWGYGLAQVMPEKAIEKDHWPPYHFAPHNAYFLIMIELGYPGIILFMSLFLLLFSGMDYRKDLSWYLILVFLINFNTESVVLDSEFACLILFSIMASTRYKNNGHSYNQLYGKNLVYHQA